MEDIERTRRAVQFSRLLAPAAALAVCACASVQEVELPDNGTGYRIDCSDTGNKKQTWAGCMDEAARVCGDSDYEIVSSREHGRLYRPGRNGTTTVEVTQDLISRMMVIRCTEQGD
jgi:hypothetical protein